MALGTIAAIAAPFIASAFAPKGGGPSFNELTPFIERRRTEINTFSRALSDARARRTARAGELAQRAFERGTAVSEAQFAGRGLQVTGGGFQAELARQAANIQAQVNLDTAQQEAADIRAVEQQRAGLFGTTFGARSQNLLGQQAGGRANQQAFGQVVGGLIPGAIQAGGSVLSGGFSSALSSIRNRGVVGGGGGGTLPRAQASLRI